MSDEELAAIEVRHKASTQYKWEYFGFPGFVGVSVPDKPPELEVIPDRVYLINGEPVTVDKSRSTICLTVWGNQEFTAEEATEIKANTQFIAAAHQDIPALLAEVRRLRDGLETAKRVYHITARVKSEWPYLSLTDCGWSDNQLSNALGKMHVKDGDYVSLYISEQRPEDE